MKCLALGALFGLLVITAHPQTNKLRPAVKPRAVSPAPKLNENAEWEKAVTLTDAAERITALKKFIKSFPRSTHLSEAGGLLATAEAGLGNERLAVSDFDAAASFFKAAAVDAPKPVPAALFKDTLATLPAALYFRGLREVGLEIADTLAKKADADPAQLTTLANFYITIENGTEARRLAESALKLDPNSSQGYQTLGLAERVDFQLEDSAAAYAKAIELDPESLTAKRGLAEMDRSLGKAEEAVALYRQILDKDASSVPARTGLVLSMFEAGQRADAEAEMAKALDENPGNVMLLAGAAYWYAVHDDPARAVSLAQKAIDSDPRFIWSHIALARGLLGQKKAVQAERVLLAARRYGNFPTLEYEIASTRLAAGLYREATEELSKSFTIHDGVIKTFLGGRVPKESKDFTELVGFERRASIFAPTAADAPESSAQLASLLQLKQELDTAKPSADSLLPAVDNFVNGDDPMKVHRQIYAASMLLEKKVGLAKALELAKAAPQVLDAGLKVPDPVTAVLASELYESRTIALARNEFINTPVISSNTLSAILRGRVEDLSGWAFYETDDAAQAAIHLRRAVSVLPADTAWWRASTWRLGNALMLNGKEAEALELYLKVYRSAPPDPVRYAAIETLYKKINGSTEGLEAKIGSSPAASPASGVAEVKRDEEPSNAASPPTRIPVTGESRTGRIPSGVPVARDTPAPTPDTSVAASPTAIEPFPESTPAAVPVDVTPVPTASAEAVPVVPERALPSPSATIDVKGAGDEIAKVTVPDEKTSGIALTTLPDTKPGGVSITTGIVPVPIPRTTVISTDTMSGAKPTAAAKDLFPSVVITIPPPVADKGSAEVTPAALPDGQLAIAQPAATPTAGLSEPEAKASTSPSPDGLDSAAPSPTPQNMIADSTPSASPSPEALEIAKPPKTTPAPSPVDDARSTEPPTPIQPCSLTTSDESVNLRVNGGDQAVIVGRADDSEELDQLTAFSISPQNVSVRREIIPGVTARAIFVLRSVSAKAGVYQVSFELPCGKKEIVVNVR